MRNRRGFTLIELLVVVAIIALLISILLPSLSRARELSKRLVCQSNVKGMGTAFKIYANDNQEQWPTPPFQDTGSPPPDIFYIAASVEIGHEGSGEGTDAMPGRLSMSTLQATTLTTTRSMWMLVRSGDVTPKQYICPSASDTLDNEQNIDLYYDFKNRNNISYGYQVPYGRRQSRASEDVDPRMCLAADRGPYNDNGTDGSGELPAESDDWTDGMTPQSWKPYNSPNHGGRGTGEGQNILFGDGHADFEKSPAQGVDEDNIYTWMTNTVSPILDGIKSGKEPNNMYPGEDSFASTTGDASTDSLIYP